MKKIKVFISENSYFTWIQFFTNWAFQGIAHADKSEKIYKISFTIIWAFIFTGILFRFSQYTYKSIILAIILGHTLNWLINCNIFVLLVHRIKWVNIPKEKYFNYLFSLKNRINNKSWVYYCVCMGSICQGKLNSTSDIDITIVRKRGIKNIILPILFYVYEKKYADFHGIPLDIFISDSAADNIKKSKNQPNPIVIYDPENNILKHFPASQTINDAKVLNNLE